MWYLTGNYDVAWYHWIIALVLQPVLGMGCLLLPIKKLQDRNFPDPWTEEEVKCFDVATKLAKKNRSL
ncbi:MAG: hypothetical protein IJ443_03705 [Firmicutes bacterium]|nr:hypothetical protein [Bacillota bacterium]